MSCTCACISLHATLDPPFVLLYLLHITLLSILLISFSTLHFMYYIVFDIVNTFHLHSHCTYYIVVHIINKFQHFTCYVVHFFPYYQYFSSTFYGCTYYIVAYIINNFQHFTFYFLHCSSFCVKHITLLSAL